MNVSPLGMSVSSVAVSVSPVAMSVFLRVMNVCPRVMITSPTALIVSEFQVIVKGICTTDNFQKVLCAWSPVIKDFIPACAEIYPKIFLFIFFFHFLTFLESISFGYTSVFIFFKLSPSFTFHFSYVAFFLHFNNVYRLFDGFF